MFDQQLDLDGGRHDLAPAHEQPHLFTSDPQLKGQTAMSIECVPTHVACVKCGCACRIQPHDHANCVQCFASFRPSEAL